MVSVFLNGPWLIQVGINQVKESEGYPRQKEKKEQSHEGKNEHKVI